jgi:hypothetical protein
MKTNTTFQKKVALLVCLLTLFNFNSKLYSQIIYTDITPDATPNASYYLDLNNDAIVDFLIYYGGGAGIAGVMCAPYNDNAYAGEFIGGAYFPWAFSASKSICDTLVTWFDSSKPGTLAMGTNTGYWPGASNRYLALKLIVGTDTYYGWARLDLLATSSSFTIKDYAYQSTPNACIQTGQSISGINESMDKQTFSIFPNPFTSSTTIKSMGNLKNASLTIYDAYGQDVKEVENFSGNTLTLSRDNLPSGIYFIRLTEENKTIAIEKLILID